MIEIMPLMFIPAAVCLAIPLYEQVEMLKENWKAIVLGMLEGAMGSLPIVVAGLLTVVGVSMSVPSL